MLPDNIIPNSNLEQKFDTHTKVDQLPTNRWYWMELGPQIENPY